MQLVVRVEFGKFCLLNIVMAVAGTSKPNPLTYMSALVDA